VLVVASVFRSTPGKPSLITVRVSCRPSRRLDAAFRVDPLQPTRRGFEGENNRARRTPLPLDHGRMISSVGELCVGAVAGQLNCAMAHPLLRICLTLR
jgi:hypothetical protein